VGYGPVDNIAQIEVCPDEVQKRFIGSNFVNPFRADSAREQNKVRLSVTDTTPTVVHELGHQVEFYLPIVEWVNIQQILHERCRTPRLIDIYNNGQEAAFDAPMPGFAAIWLGDSSKYGGKIYADGDTEVVSMSMECAMGSSDEFTNRPVHSQSPFEVVAAGQRAVLLRLWRLHQNGIL
jgi:hypothetical protein